MSYDEANSILQASWSNHTVVTCTSRAPLSQGEKSSTKAIIFEFGGVHVLILRVITLYICYLGSTKTDATSTAGVEAMVQHR